MFFSLQNTLLKSFEVFAKQKIKNPPEPLIEFKSASLNPSKQKKNLVKPIWQILLLQEQLEGGRRFQQVSAVKHNTVVFYADII